MNFSEGYDAFALGMEEEPESAEIREHVHRDCPNCVPGIRTLFNSFPELTGLVEVVESACTTSKANPGQR